MQPSSSSSTWNRLEVHRPSHITRKIPTADPGRVARLAQRMAGRTCAMRCLQTGPKTCVERVAIGGEKSRCCSTSQSKVVAAFLHFAWKGSNNGAGRFQPTHNFTCLESAACHGALKHCLFQSRTKGMEGDSVNAARRFDVRKAIGQCIGPNGSPEPCRSTDDVIAQT